MCPGHTGSSTKAKAIEIGTTNLMLCVRIVDLNFVLMTQLGVLEWLRAALCQTHVGGNEGRRTRSENSRMPQKHAIKTSNAIIVFFTPI